MVTTPPASDHLEERDGAISYIRTDPDLPPVAVVDRSPITGRHRLAFTAVAALGAIAWAVVATARGETVNAVWLVAAAACTYVIGFRGYARLIELKIVQPRDDRATPAEIFEDGTDYVPTDRRVLFGHHFAAIAGAGPLVGPVLATQMGYLPSAIWIVFGAVLAGCVQDYLVLWCSTRRRGRSLGQLARDELGVFGGAAAIIAVLVIMVILIAVLALIVVRALAESPWGLFTIAMTIPIAILMGVYLRFLRPGRVGEVSAIGVTLLLLDVAAGRWVAETSWGATWFTLSPVTLSWCVIGYGLAASVLPVWLLLAPRDYLSTFMKVGTVALLAAAILIVRPSLTAPAVSSFARAGDGPVFAGSLFPFLFITIACGALSGFHSLIASGTTPKLLEKERQMRLIGYGGMLTESFVAVVALITACILDQHLYFALNAPLAQTGGTPDTAAAYVNGLGLSGPPVSAEQIEAAAAGVGENSIVSRTGGAPTLAFGMAEVLQRAIGGTGLRAFWYHFAIMFEALFILATVDAGTRVARFMLSDALANLGGPVRRLRDPSWRVGAWTASLAVVGAWGGILLMGVTDPLGGINTLYPLFGIANQLLAAIALTVVTVVVIRNRGLRWAWIPGLPLAWDLAVTMTASWQKIFSGDPRVGYWTQHVRYRAAQRAGETAFGSATDTAQLNAVVRNTFIQGTLSVVFAVLVLTVVIAGAITVLRTLRDGPSVTEDPPLASRRFAPAGLIASTAERDVERQWVSRAMPAASSGYRRYLAYREAGTDPGGRCC